MLPVKMCIRDSNVAARLADNLRQRFLGVRKLVYQPLKTLSFLNGREIFAQEVFNQSDFQNLFIVKIFYNDRNLIQPGNF